MQASASVHIHTDPANRGFLSLLNKGPSASAVGMSHHDDIMHHASALLARPPARAPLGPTVTAAAGVEVEAGAGASIMPSSESELCYNYIKIYFNNRKCMAYS
jgi:hypothetical protein